MLGPARYTETDEVMVVYESLYASDWFDGVQYATRPLSMRNETVERQGERYQGFVLED